MGAYCEFKLNDIALFLGKNYVSNIFMSVFRESDKIIRYENLDGEQIKKVEYVISAKKYRDRLNIMGFTIEKARLDFDNQLKEMQREGYILDDYLNSGIDIGCINFEYFKKMLKIIVDGELLEYALEEVNEQNVEFIKYMLEDDTYMFGVPSSDPRYVIQMILSMYNNDDDYIIYDISDLIESGYFNENYNFSENAIQEIKSEYIYNEKIIILTEGKTDAKVIKASMEKLYPHISNYYSFFDFDLTKSPGSTSEVVKMVKSFISSGIGNRVIALFDNDSAGEDAIRQLQNIKNIPSNIRILKYPDIEIANDYPTKGPSGDTKMNINGMACSIELYVGRDVLYSKGYLIPVKWTGYIDGVGKYQGKIEDKDYCTKRFLDCIQDENINKDNFDFSGVDTILQVIFNAFN